MNNINIFYYYDEVRKLKIAHLNQIKGKNNFERQYIFTANKTFNEP